MQVQIGMLVSNMARIMKAPHVHSNMNCLWAVGRFCHFKICIRGAFVSFAVGFYGCAGLGFPGSWRRSVGAKALVDEPANIEAAAGEVTADSGDTGAVAVAPAGAS